MNGWLIYDGAGARKNQWFIDRLIELGTQAGVSLSLRICEGTETFAGEKLPDFAIVRTIAPQLNVRLEALGVRTFNNAETSRIANDKWLTYRAGKEWDIPVLPTRLLTEASPSGGAAYPCVIKSRDGHGGAEVYRATNALEYARAANALTSAGKKGIVQEQNKVLGKDVRLYALGGEIVAGVLRTSAGDFRSNFSLGGKVQPFEADERQRAIVARLYEKLRFDYVGVDLLPDGAGGWVLNEIEDAAGARMLYQTSDIDIAERFLRHVIRQIQIR